MAVAARHAAATGGEMHEVQEVHEGQEVVAAPRSTGPSLVVLGLVTLLVGAWGAIVPYVGPLFGFDADGTPAWHWSLAHALLGLVPGGVAVVAGILLLGLVGRASAGRGRVDVGLLGFVVALCGAWFIIGEFAWPVLHGTGYFVGAAPLHYLLEQLAFAIGTGTVLAVCGAFAMGWAVRHHRRSVLVRDERTVGTATPATTPAPSTVPAGVPTGAAAPVATRTALSPVPGPILGGEG